MYIRTVRNRLKDGSVASYVQLARNLRDPTTGRSKLEVVASLGREDTVDCAGLRRLAKSINRFLDRQVGLHTLEGGVP
jgi:hypothetical protein